MENIIYLIIGLSFALLAILIIAIVAFRNAKPTTVNNGTIHNYYFEGEGEKNPRQVVDENILFAARSMGEAVRAYQGIEKDNHKKEKRSLRK
jgi:hypothetical protein